MFSALLSQSVATTPGASYTIDFFLARSGDANGILNVSWGGSTILSITNQSAFGYTHYTFTVTASTASTTLLFDFRNDITNRLNRWLLDDVSVNPAGVGVPDGGSTVSLLGFASLGLVALRRKLSC
jgi:protein with PEP-CTERM/exosortase system signal